MFGTCLTVGEPLLLPGEPENMTYQVSWSFYLCAVAVITNTVAGVLLLFEMINKRTLRYVQRRDEQTSPSGGESGSTRLDNSFSPYTSFPDLDNETLQVNGDTNTDNVLTGS